MAKLYAGLAGLKLAGDAFDLGDGIRIEGAFGHLMLPFVMAFKPAPLGKPHPGPWRAVRGSSGMDMTATLLVPDKIGDASEWEVARTIVFLLRLGVDPATTVPVLSSHPFAELATMPEHETKISVLETRARAFALIVDQAALGEPQAAWLRERWRKTLELLRSSAEFELAVAAMDAGQFERNTALTMVALWSALEAIFAGDRNELKFRLSTYIASYLEAHGPERAKLQKAIAKLYDKRSAAVHGLPKHSADDVLEVFSLMRAVLMKIIDAGRVPTRLDLETALFG